MPLDPSLVGHHLGRISVVCDDRWLMSFAAGVPDERAQFYDTTTRLAAHPLFPVAPEWELLVTHRVTQPGLTVDEVRRGIHVAHDVIMERPIRSGDQVVLEAQVASVDRRPAGATQQLLFTATDSGGHVVWRTMLTSLFLGAELVGQPLHADVGWPVEPLSTVRATTPIASRQSFVRTVDAHVYTECARIWNPIHTDVVAARRAGLAQRPLHGTATLARAVSIATDLAGMPIERVRRVTARFGAVVDLGSTIDIRLRAVDGRRLSFDVITGGGRPAIADGVIIGAA